MIARECGVSRAAVLLQLKKFGIDVSKTRKTKSANAKSDYLNKTWLTAQLKKGVSIFRISKDQGVSYPEASGHGSSQFSSLGKIPGLTFQFA
jgi:hypothetical protein